jgi:hypothetical protein
MDAIDEYSGLVSSIFDAALDFEKWPTVLERLADVRPVGSCESDREVIPKEELVRGEFYNDSCCRRTLTPRSEHTS